MPKFLQESSRDIFSTIGKEGVYLSSYDLLKLLEGDPSFKFLGRGQECIVLESGSHDKNIAVAINYKFISPAEQKIIFYHQRIFAALFPHNFPRFFAASGQKPPESRPSLTIRELVTPDEPGKILYPISSVEKTSKDMGVELHLSKKPKNIIVAPDGGEYYVDTLHFNDVIIPNPSNTKEYIDSNFPKNLDADLAKKAIDRCELLKKHF